MIQRAERFLASPKSDEKRKEIDELRPNLVLSHLRDMAREMGLETPDLDDTGVEPEKAFDPGFAMKQNALIQRTVQALQRKTLTNLICKIVKPPP